MTFGANALVLCGVFAACSVRGGPAPKVSNRPPPPETAALIDARCRGPGKDACLLAWRQLDGVGGVREHELELASRIIAVGGWLCYAFSLELIGGASWSEAFAADARMHVGIKAMCGESAAVRSADQGVVVVWHHNGLGNQIWEYLFGRLMADDLGYHLSSHKIEPAFYPGTSNREPPNSGVGFEAFHSWFESEKTLAEGAFDHSAYCARGNVTLATRPADTRARPFVLQMHDVLPPLGAPQVLPPCIFTVGYWQTYPLLVPNRKRVEHLMSLALPPGAEAPGPREAVVHVRTCDTGGGGGNGKHPSGSHYAYLSVDNYYGPIFDAMKPSAVKIVTACPKGSALDELKARFNATLIKPPTRGVGGMAYDYAYMMSAKYLVLAQSTFSFWAGFFSAAEQVHSPHNNMPIVYDEDRFVYHDLYEKEQKWGIFNEERNAIDWSAKGKLPHEGQAAGGGGGGGVVVVPEKEVEAEAEEKEEPGKAAPVPEKPQPKRDPAQWWDDVHNDEKAAPEKDEKPKPAPVPEKPQPKRDPAQWWDDVHNDKPADGHGDGDGGGPAERPGEEAAAAADEVDKKLLDENQRLGEEVAALEAKLAALR